MPKLLNLNLANKSGKMSLMQLRKGFQISLPKMILKNAQSNLSSYLILYMKK